MSTQNTTTTTIAVSKPVSAVESKTRDPLFDEPSDSELISADFDLDALFDEQCEGPSSDHESHVLHLPTYKRPMTPPSETEVVVKHPRVAVFYPPYSPPELLLPEDVVDMSPLESSSSSSSSSADNASIATIRQMKERMISAHTLLTTYTVLKKTSTQVSTQLKATNTQLADANKWRFLLADENARLRSRVSIVTKEKENLKAAITKLHGDTNGIQKNEALRNELMEKNREIARL